MKFYLRVLCYKCIYKVAILYKQGFKAYCKKSSKPYYICTIAVSTYTYILSFSTPVHFWVSKLRFEISILENKGIPNLEASGPVPVSCPCRQLN